MRLQVSSLVDVRRLNFWGAGLTDMGLVRRLIALEVLSLSMNEITSLEPLANCVRVREVYLRKNRVQTSQLAYLAALPQLQVLWLSDNPCTSEPFYKESVMLWCPSLLILDQRDVTSEDRAASVRQLNATPTFRNAMYDSYRRLCSAGISVSPQTKAWIVDATSEGASKIASVRGSREGGGPASRHSRGESKYEGGGDIDRTPSRPQQRPLVAIPAGPNPPSRTSTPQERPEAMAPGAGVGCGREAGNDRVFRAATLLLQTLSDEELERASGLIGQLLTARKRI